MCRWITRAAALTAAAGNARPVAIILFALIARQVSGVGMGIATLICDRHRRDRPFTVASGVTGAGIDRLLFLRDRIADGNLAGAQPRAAK